ncbi:MAG: hypothetical protein H6657_23845 [Ardenticatenaceae bacterium]|nr:hypothetical protein [Ardenticatenaceae bacterium]
MFSKNFKSSMFYRYVTAIFLIVSILLPPFQPVVAAAPQTIGAAASSVVCADFNQLAAGSSVEGLGTVHPDLNISSTGNAVSINENGEPFAYQAPNDAPFPNLGVSPFSGFFDEQRLHQYSFSFSPGVSVNLFSIKMLDYGDRNEYFATEHEVSLIAYDANNSVVDIDTLAYTSDTSINPRTGSAGDLFFTGDAATQTGNPGNFNFVVNGSGITRLELEFSNNVAPSHSDSYFGLAVLCFQSDSVTPPSGTQCANFADLAPGTSVEGLGMVHPALNISTTGNAVSIRENSNPFAYQAPNVGTPIPNLGVDPFDGFYDQTLQHDYSFSFAADTSVNYFTLKILDYGDRNEQLATEHNVTLVAYDTNGNVVDEDVLSYTSDATINPHTGSAGDLFITGDAATQSGNPGNYTFVVEGEGITRLELAYGNNVNDKPSDSYFGLAVLCFEPEETAVNPPQGVSCANFADLAPGTSVEGLGMVHPALNISTTGNAVSIRENSNPFAYQAPNVGTPIPNLGVDPFDGFYDQTLQHDYSFSFAADTSVNYFTLKILDYGDRNEQLATEHNVTLVAYDTNGNVVDEDVLSYTSDATINPHTGSAGDLFITGDAATQSGNPGNYTFVVEGEGITRLELAYGNNVNDKPSDSYFGLAVLCFEPEETAVNPPQGVSCANFADLAPGTSVEGLGMVHPALNISTTGNAVSIRENSNPFAYQAPNVGTPIPNLGVDPFDGFYDQTLQHDYSFSFAADTSVNYFTLKILDYGDRNEQLATEHNVTLVAYDTNGNVVDEDVLSYTSDATINPHTGSAGDLFITGDAATQSGNPGNYTFVVEGEGITRLELAYGNNVNDKPSDSYFGLAVLCFEPEEPPTPPTDTPLTCEDIGYETIAEDSWNVHVIRDMRPVSLQFDRPEAASYAIVNTGWEWTGALNQFQVTEKHTVDTPFGSTTSDDYGNEELAGQVLWYDNLQGAYSQSMLPITINYAGDGSDEGSHRSHGLVAWCAAPGD